MNCIRFLFFILVLPVSVVSQTEFSQDSAGAILHHIAVDIGPRPMGSPAEHDGLQFAVTKFKEFGCDTAYLMRMDFTPTVNTQSGTAVGILRGTTGRIILIGGHMDSAGPEIPGADDDGSGSAVVLECCRVLARHAHSSTFVFCCFGGEEQGLQGSNYFCNHFLQMDSIALMLQVDMANGLGIIDMDPDGHNGFSAPRWLVRASAEEFATLGYHQLRYPTHFFSINYGGGTGAGSDHESFLAKGIPAVDFSTDVDKPIHTPRDNIENFDPRGLKRSGDLIVKLANRFDGGVPNRNLERYWLYLAGTTPVFLPVWSCWVIFLLALSLSGVTAVSLHRNQGLLPAIVRVRWSGVKIWFVTVFIVACGWFSSDCISLLRGIRFPWLTSLPVYYIFAIAAMLIGLTPARWIIHHFRIASKPLGLYLRAVILLMLLSIGLSLWNIKLLIEPSIALILLNLAILVSNRLIKSIFLLLSPVWPLRLIFSEWDGLLFHPLARSLTHTLLKSFLFSGGALLVLSLMLLPFAFGAMAIVRQKPQNERIFYFFTSGKTVPVFIALFLGIMIYLLEIPPFNNLWFKSVEVTANYSASDHTKNLIVQSAEYLRGSTIRGKGCDTTITGLTTAVVMKGGDQFDTSWVHIQRKDSVVTSGALSFHNILLRITSAERPYTVRVTYSPSKNIFPSFSTSWKFQTTGNNQKKIEWYSFPDTVLTVPVSFTLGERDSVNEEITVTFASLAWPLMLEEEFSYLIPRTNYTYMYKYHYQ